MPKELNRDKKKKYTVWTQGPDDATSKKMKRTFKQTTPGQVRDYATLVKSRSFQRFEQVKRTDEETPANATGSAIANFDPLLGDKNSPKVYVRKKRQMDNKLDGRTKAYRTVTKRIKERNARAAERETTSKLSQFGVTSNPFREENKMDNKKYLKTKEGSIEQAVLDSLNTESPINPNSLRPTLTLPENRYFSTKEESVEWSGMKAVAEAHDPGHLPRQLKDKKKEKMVGVKDKSGKVQTKVVDKDDKKYANHPLHAEVEHDEDLTEKGWFPGMTKKSGDAGKGATSGTDDDKSDKAEKKFGKQKEKKRGASDSSGLSKFKAFQKKDKDDQDEDPVGKDTETQTDKDDEDEDEENGKMKKKGKKQNLRDKDDEAEGSRSKDRPTAETFSNYMDQKKEKYWSEKKSYRAPVEEIEEEETVIITSMEQLEELDHEEFGFETREEMYEYVEAELQEKDSRRTDDAIDAYDKSKDASRDADWDTEHGKKKKGDKEKKYAKKERDEIDKDDPDWKHKKGHTGMHGEAKDSFVVPSTASSSKTAPGEGGIPKPKDAKLDGDVKNDKKKEHKDAKEVQDIDNRESNVGESMSPLMAAVVADISKRESKKKLTESSAGGRGERDIGTDAYADYTKNLTPGQSAGTVPPANPSVTSSDAKKADKKQKEDNAQKQRQATVVDDEYHPQDVTQQEGAVAQALAKARAAQASKVADWEAKTGRFASTPKPEINTDRGAITAYSRKKPKNKASAPNDPRNKQRDTTYSNKGHLTKRYGEAYGVPSVDMPMHELLGIPFTAKARLARQQKKGARIKTRTDLATAKLSNIQARDKLKAAKGKLRDARAARNVTAEYQPEIDEAKKEKVTPVKKKSFVALKRAGAKASQRRLGKTGSPMSQRTSSGDQRSWGLSSEYQPEDSEMVNEATKGNKKGSGSQRAPLGQKVPGHWRKMGKDEVSDRIRSDAYKKRPGIKRTYSTGTDQPKGPDKVKKKQGTKKKASSVNDGDGAPKQTGPIGGGKVKSAMKVTAKRRYSRNIARVQSIRADPLTRLGRRQVKNPRGVPDHEPPKRVEPRKGAVPTHTQKPQPKRKGKAAKVPSDFSPVARPSASKWKGQTSQRSDTRRHTTRKEDMSALIAATLDELSKATHRLSKENMLLAPKGKGRKAAKRMYGEDNSIVDAVQEVLGLGNKWPGMEKMPKTDPKKKTSRGTDAYVTGKSKIERLPKKEDVEMDESPARANSGWQGVGHQSRHKGYRSGEWAPEKQSGPTDKQRQDRKTAAKKGGKKPKQVGPYTRVEDVEMNGKARLAQALKNMHNEYEID